jgi:phospholipid-binding lipoprotein MlaA
MLVAPFRFLHFFLATLLLALATGCATGPNAHPTDPLEPMNRAVYKFNDAVDTAVLKPIATGYKAAVPSPIRTGVSNFFSNLGDVWSMVNHVLQFEFANAGKTAARLGINTFLGLGGVLDIATDAGIEAPKADLGQTLGKWGVPSGPYVMLPLLGPSSVRDGVGTITATYHDPVNRVSDNATRNVLTVTRVVDARTRYLGATDAVDEIALDKYTFIRDVYLKRRQNQIAPQKPSDKAAEDDIDYSAEVAPQNTQEQLAPKLPSLPSLPALPSLPILK